jgi:hypothetical protein
MAANDNNEKPSLGERARALIEPALEREERRTWQLGHLNEVFNSLARALPHVLENNFNQFESMVQVKKPTQRDEFIIFNLTMATDNTYSPILRQQLPIAPDFIEFAASDICELPGYIALHTAMRDADIAIKFTGLVAEESRGGMAGPPTFTVDLTKTYAQGSMENSSLYPNLPEKPAVFNRKKSGDFKM